MKLKEPKIEDIKLLEQYVDEFVKNNETIHGAYGLNKNNIKEWILNLKNYKNKETLPDKNLVTAHTFIAIIDNKIVGIINIRHYLNEYLLNFGGHIGYSIAPSERKKGYAKKMLSKTLEFSFENLKLKKVLLTCDSLNEASIKTILANNGIFENYIYENNNKTNRYWIYNKKELK